MSNWKFYEGTHAYMFRRTCNFQGKVFRELAYFPKEDRHTIFRELESSGSLMNIKEMFLWKFLKLNIDIIDDMTTLDATLWYMKMGTEDPIKSFRTRRK